MIQHLKFYFNKRIIRRFLILVLIVLIIACFIKLNLPLDISDRSEKNDSLLNLEDFQYIIQNKVCNEDIYLLIVIHSAPNHFQHRNIIRDTWGNPDINISTIKVVFLLAASTQFQEDIEKENKLYHDIVQGNFIDSYRNLTYKHVMGLQWAFENCAQAKYLLKMDDDIFMDIYQFIEYINKHFNTYKLQKTIACFLQSGMPVVRDPVSKWYVSKAEYEPDIFENYCSGWAYLTTTNAAKLLFEKVKSLNYFWVDDVHITGTVAKIANVSQIKINDLYDLESDGLIDWSRNPENLKWNKMFAPTWGDLALSRQAYKKTLKCNVIKCKCCYSRKIPPRTTQRATTRKGVAELMPI